MSQSIARRRWFRFRQNKGSFLAFMLFWTVLTIALLSPILANDKPLWLFYKGKTYYPLFETVLDSDLDGNLPTEADFTDNYTQYQISQNGRVLMPLIPWSYDTIDYASPVAFPAPPSSRHVLGTDDEGRDILARLLYGLRQSLLFGLALTFCSAVIGVLVGAIQGYFGGRTDLLIGRFLEIWGSLPQLFILIIISSLITPGFFTLLFVLLLFSWTNLTGVVRAEFLKTRNLDYVKAAKVLGVSDWKIMIRHILPNALVATITYIPFILAGAVVALSALDFLGLGLPPGEPSLGDMLRQGKENLHAPWIGLTIFTVLTFLLSILLFIGEGIRDIFDPYKGKKL